MKALETAALAALLALAPGCKGELPPEPVERVQLAASRAPAQAERLRVEVVRALPHDTSAFTQGLLLEGGRLFESTGLTGQSSLREVELETGRVRRLREIPRPYFGEGLAKVGGELIMLTWREGKAFRFDAETFEPRGEHDYEGEGWGLAYDGKRLVMSDGSDQLQFRDPATFQLLSRVRVRLDGRPVQRLNELEIIDGLVYANVWQTDRIVAVDAQTGEVKRVIDASGMLQREERRRADVLNGIAHDPARDAVYITGKNWPWLFEVRFVPDERAP